MTTAKRETALRDSAHSRTMTGGGIAVLTKMVQSICYNPQMRNWSTKTSRMDKNSPQYAIWKLEQQLNFGLGENEKLSREALKKYLPVLNIDDDTRKLMEFLLYDKIPDK